MIGDTILFSTVMIKAAYSAARKVDVPADNYMSESFRHDPLSGQGFFVSPVAQPGPALF
jgi:hypothetical protein